MVILKFRKTLKEFSTAEKNHLFVSSKQNLEIQVSSCSIRNEDSVKLLGIHINNNWSFDFHVNQLRNKRTAWKLSNYGVISGSYFPVFGLNTDQKKHRIWTVFTQWRSKKLHALAWIAKCMDINKRRTPMKAFLSSQFFYTLLIGMYRSRKMKHIG